MSKRALLLLATAAVVLAAATAAVILATGGDESQPAAAEHAGMVEGTVWVANEDGASLTAIDAARTVARIAVGSKPNGISFSPLALGLVQANKVDVGLEEEMDEMGHG